MSVVIGLVAGCAAGASLLLARRLRGGAVVTGAVLARLLLAAWFVAPLAALGLWAVAGRWSADSLLSPRLGVTGMERGGRRRGGGGAVALGVARQCGDPARDSGRSDGGPRMLRVGPRLRAAAAMFCSFRPSSHHSPSCSGWTSCSSGSRSRRRWGW